MSHRTMVWRSLLRSSGGQAIVSAMVASTITVAYLHFGHDQLHVSTAFTGALGMVMAIILGFKNNSAYSRWWEARTLWGAIVNDSRNWARQTEALLGAGAAGRELMGRQVAFVNALRMHLARQVDPEALAPFVAADEIADLQKTTNVPAQLLRIQGRRLADTVRDVGADAVCHMTMEDTLVRLSNAQGGCERINNTPFPAPYDDMVHVFVWLYCIAFPFTLVGELGYWTVPASILICVVFQGIDGIGRLLANPFTGDPESVPMATLCRTIEDNLGFGKPVT